MQNLHSFLRPSAADRWSRCTAAPGEEEKYPNTSSPAADEGTLAHQVLERLLLGADISDIQNQEAMIRNLQVVVNYVEDQVKTHRVAYVTEETVEIGQHIGFLPGVISGTCDLRMFAARWLELLDLKYGYTLVEPKGNRQLILYAAPHITDKPDDFPVRLTIAQPRHPTEAPIRWWDTTAGEIRQHLAVIAAAGNQVYVNPQFVPGEKQCYWCRARFDCEARRQQNTAVVEGHFRPVAEVMEQAKIQGADHTVGAGHIAELMFKIPEIEKWITDIRKEAYRLAQQGVLPGWKLVAGKRVRKWMDGEAALKKTRAWRVNGHSLGLDGVAPRHLLSPSAMEKIPGLSSGQKKSLREMVETTHGRPVLVPESDPKPAVKIDTESHFEEVQPEETSFL